jgi:hypothetical protein
MYKTRTSVKRGDVHLHGWDSGAGSWHGPISLALGRRAIHPTLTKMKTARGTFHGNLRCSVSGLPCIDFHTSVYDLKDTGLAIVHSEGSHGGPVGIVAVVPTSRRRLLRNDFAFELMTLISFLGAPINSGSELAIHDYIQEVMRTDSSATQIFAVETAELISDTSIVLSAHFEQLALTMLDWLDMRGSQNDPVLEGAECEDYERTLLIN